MNEEARDVNVASMGRRDASLLAPERASFTGVGKSRPHLSDFSGRGIAVVATLWGLLGIGGVVYAGIVAGRMRRQTTYKPVVEDWLFHLLLPFIAYAMLAISACIAYGYARPALFVVGAAGLLLLFIGIHNA